MEAKPLARGDACPNCGGAFKLAPEPSSAQRAAAAHREEPVSLPAHFDTASPEFRAEHGALARCVDCSYATRFPITSDAAAATK